MAATLVSIAFWLTFTLAAGIAALFLLGTIIRNHKLSTARYQVDDGSDDPDAPSYKLYVVSTRSGALAITAFVSFIPLFSAGVMAFAGTSFLAGIGALALATVVLIVSDALRERHDRLDAAFRTLAGRPVDEVYAEVIEVMSPTRTLGRADRSAPAD